ncbi:BadF/BadG/BcrA/BcrD ATPase family protein [Leeia oryzae]|uniref:BadF/BadG/BcrA/BcrD ATPase family protein n=1 Tax=Leeia oryzae TaxID=356662 RepID=UPI000381E575|nr:BadF/BadG/BcrA/BcrD ATPase family protein [Leeia oryzae]
MSQAVFHLAVDGGGTSTRLAVYDHQHQERIRVTGGPSALGQGIAQAWANISSLCQQALAGLGAHDVPLGACAIGLGLSGVHNPVWAAEFLAAAPAFAQIALHNDVHTALLGAHDGKPGILMILGTGSAAEAWLPDGRILEAGGWGFPSGDEASGAWLGLAVAQLLQKRLDGRLQPSPLTDAALAECGGHKAAVQHWLAGANQGRFATLAPLVVRHADDDELARQLLEKAAQEIAAHIRALDETATLPVVLSGGLASALSPWLPDALQQRLCPARHDAVYGAYLYLLQQHAPLTGG